MSVANTKNSEYKSTRVAPTRDKRDNVNQCWFSGTRKALNMMKHDNNLAFKLKYLRLVVYIEIDNLINVKSPVTRSFKYVESRQTVLFQVCISTISSAAGNK